MGSYQDTQTPYLAGGEVGPVDVVVVNGHGSVSVSPFHGTTEDDRSPVGSRVRDGWSEKDTVETIPG